MRGCRRAAWSTTMLRIVFGGPLEAEIVAVGIGEVELLHSVGRYFGRFEMRDFVAQLFVDVGCPEIDAGVVVRFDARRIGLRRTLVIGFVGGVKHDLAVWES